MMMELQNRQIDSARNGNSIHRELLTSSTGKQKATEDLIVQKDSNFEYRRTEYRH
jgi:hypothetical protein